MCIKSQTQLRCRAEKLDSHALVEAGAENFTGGSEYDAETVPTGQDTRRLSFQSN